MGGDGENDLSLSRRVGSPRNSSPGAAGTRLRLRLLLLLLLSLECEREKPGAVWFRKWRRMLELTLNSRPQLGQGHRKAVGVGVRVRVQSRNGKMR
jgi:hypothetical protein